MANSDWENLRSYPYRPVSNPNLATVRVFDTKGTYFDVPKTSFIKFFPKFKLPYNSFLYEGD